MPCHSSSLETPDSCDQSTETIKDRLCSANSPDGALKVLTETTLIRDESIAALSLDITEQNDTKSATRPGRNTVSRFI